MKNNKVITAIAAYLEPRYGTISSRLLQATNEQQVSQVLNTVATEIFTAISPLVEVNNRCQGCNAKEGAEPHICPFKSHFHDDNQSKCNCCDLCEEECWCK